MQSIFNSSEFLKVLQTRVDRISDAEKNELRKAVNDTYDTYEGFLNSDRSFNTAIENGWVIKKGGEYILNPTDNISLRIQSLRMLCGFEREYTAALIGVTRQTYTKLEASGYEGGLNQAYIETLKDKSREKLYLLGENPKYADLWSFLVAPKETGETKVSKEKSDSLVNTFNDLINEESFLFNQFLEFLKIKDKDYLRKIIDKRKVGLKESDSTKFNYIYYADNQFSDVEVIKEQIKIIKNEINKTNKNMIELLLQSNYLSEKLFNIALPDGLYKKYLDSPDRHRDTVNDYLNDKNLDSSEIFDKRKEELFMYITYLLVQPDIDW